MYTFYRITIESFLNILSYYTCIIIDNADTWKQVFFFFFFNTTGFDYTICKICSNYQGEIYEAAALSRCGVHPLSLPGLGLRNPGCFVCVFTPQWCVAALVLVFGSPLQVSGCRAPVHFSAGDYGSVTLALPLSAPGWPSVTQNPTWTTEKRRKDRKRQKHQRLQAGCSRNDKNNRQCLLS